MDVGVIYTHERELVKRLLTTMRDSADGPATRLILVDNDSADGVEPWRRIMPATLVLRNTERLGYAVNLNRILASSSARYVLLLNTDMYFDPSNRCLTRHGRVYGCPSRLWHCRLPALSCRRGATLGRRDSFKRRSVILARRFGLGGVLHKTVDRYLNRHRDPADSFECDWLSGCFMMVRREAIEAVGLFDESFGEVLRGTWTFVGVWPRPDGASCTMALQAAVTWEQRASHSLMSVRRMAASAGVSLLAEQVGGLRAAATRQNPARPSVGERPDFFGNCPAVWPCLSDCRRRLS